MDLKKAAKQYTSYADFFREYKQLYYTVSEQNSITAEYLENDDMDNFFHEAKILRDLEKQFYDMYMLAQYFAYAQPDHIQDSDQINKLTL